MFTFYPVTCSTGHHCGLQHTFCVAQLTLGGFLAVPKRLLQSCAACSSLAKNVHLISQAFMSLTCLALKMCDHRVGTAFWTALQREGTVASIAQLFLQARGGKPRGSALPVACAGSLAVILDAAVDQKVPDNSLPTAAAAYRAQRAALLASHDVRALAVQIVLQMAHCKYGPAGEAEPPRPMAAQHICECRRC